MFNVELTIYCCEFYMRRRALYKYQLVNVIVNKKTNHEDEIRRFNLGKLCNGNNGKEDDSVVFRYLLGVFI